MDIATITNIVLNSVHTYNLTADQDARIINNLVFDNIDSLALTAFVVSIENELEKQSINVDLSDITRQNFESLNTIINYIWTCINKPVKKLIVVDLDNTLWNGIVGDDLTVVPNIELQQRLLELKTKGMLLAIISKNEIKPVVQVFTQNDMLLTMDDFVSTRINWLPKALNMQELLIDLNFGPEAVIFIDDMMSERTSVQEQFPEITVRDTLYLTDISLAISTYEDAHRLQMYKEEKLRRKLKTTQDSIDMWIKMLEITIVKYDCISGSVFQRVLQLLNKSNQMNSCTRRFTEASLYAELNQNTFHMWAFSIKDKFGDMGITAILGFTVHNNVIIITDFVLSCRVMGRCIEDCILYMLINFAKKLDVHIINILYYPTAKNVPMMKYLVSKNFNCINNTFQYDVVNSSWVYPGSIKLS